MGDLYDFYGALLTDRQSQILEMYHIEDLSLGEISQNLSISRQAVHDQLRRARDQLEAYEAALALQASAEQQRRCWRVLTETWAQLSTDVSEANREEMQRALQQMSQTLSSLTGGDGGA